MRIKKFNEDSILERRNLKNYTKYNDFIKDELQKFERSKNSIEKFVMYDEDNMIHVELKTWNGITSTNIDNWQNYFGDFGDYVISPANGSQLNIILYDIQLPEDFFRNLDVKMSMQKYNL